MLQTEKDCSWSIEVFSAPFCSAPACKPSPQPGCADCSGNHQHHPPNVHSKNCMLTKDDDSKVACLLHACRLGSTLSHSPVRKKKQLLWLSTYLPFNNNDQASYSCSSKLSTWALLSTGGDLESDWLFSKTSEPNLSGFIGSLLGAPSVLVRLSLKIDEAKDTWQSTVDY